MIIKSSAWWNDNDNLWTKQINQVVFFVPVFSKTISISSFNGQTIYIILGQEKKKVEANAVRLRQKIQAGRENELQVLTGQEAHMISNKPLFVLQI